MALALSRSYDPRPGLSGSAAALDASNRFLDRFRFMAVRSLRIGKDFR